MKQAPPQQIVVRYIPPPDNGWWGTGMWIILLLLFGFLAFAIFYAVPVRRDLVKNALPAEEKITSHDTRCTKGEEYSEQFGICAPECPVPNPVVQEIFDYSVADCTSFYHKTCGEWIREHTNQDRSFSFAAQRNDRIIDRIIRSDKSGPLYRLYRSCIDTLIYRFHVKEDNVQRDYVLQEVLNEFRSMYKKALFFVNFQSIT
jgi:hypothetical protein